MKPSLDKIHEAAKLFPLLEGASFDEFVADIAAHGQREAVYMLPDGRLIDGRNRVRACEKLGRIADSVLYRDDASDEAITRFVVSQNIHRRHLDKGQRAMIAVEVEKVFAEAARKRMAEGGRSKGMADLPPPSKARDEAAASVGVSGRQVQKAKYVTKHGVVELDAAVRGGKISLNKAEGIARKPKERQRTLVHESVVEIPALKQQRKQAKDAMTLDERRAENERERKGAEIASRRARCVGLLDTVQAVAKFSETRDDFIELLPDGVLVRLDTAIRAAKTKLDQLEKVDAKREAV